MSPARKPWLLIPLVAFGITFAAPLTKNPSPDNDELLTYRYVLIGRNLDPSEVKNLERVLKVHPKDLSFHTMLLGYYFKRQFLSKDYQKAREKHLLWVIENHPDSFIAGFPESQIDRYRDAEFYDLAKKEWLYQVESRKGDVKILSNAAEFLESDDKEIAEKFLQKGLEMEPKNPSWSKGLGRLYRLRALRAIEPARTNFSIQSLDAYETAYKLTETSKKFYFLPLMSAEAFDAGDMKKAKAYCGQMLAESANRDYLVERGDVVHRANIILGRIALKAGDVKEAEECLLRAGKTPGSMLLDSFGPNMMLAKELLDKGEKATVLRYLQLCARFWRRQDKLKEWTALVKAGEIPDFEANLEY